ncbi:MAG: ammonium transporter [Phycisphaerae bacterium]
MKRRALWLILMTALLGIPLTAMGADEKSPSPAAVKAAMEMAGTDAETQKELKKLYDETEGSSKAYESVDTPEKEDVEVEVAGVKDEVTIYREKTDTEKHALIGAVLWTAVAAFLVFFMQAGFAMVETGFTRAKNAVNIIMKNVMDFSIGIIAFFIIGFHLMFSGGSESLFFLGNTQAADWGMTFFIFQAVFCATAATIVSGAMAERTKFVSYLVYSAIISAIIYPISGSWAWGSLLDGEGWLETFWTLTDGDKSYSVFFSDFAGSTVVHSVGGWLALAGAIVLGPRIGKYGPDGKPRAIMGHNIPLAALGVFILFFGWFGFNPGSTTTFDMSLGGIAVTTGLAAAAGGTLAMLTSWVISKKPDGSMTLNGILAGLVAITAPCATVTPAWAVVIGAIGGVLVVLAVIFIDSVLKVDDPVGAVAVHGVCGAWGTLAAGLFNTPVEAWEGGPMIGGILVGGTIDQLIVQLVGIVTVFAYAFVAGLIMFFAIRFTIGLRVSEEEELRGLDVGEHGMEAYTGFQIFTTT